MTRSTKLLDHAMIVLAVVLGVGSVALLVVMGPVPFVQMGWPESRLLAWDAALSFAFFLQHSGMVRRRFRARLASVIAPRYQGAVYTVASGVVLTLVVVLWQRSETHLLVLQGAPLWIARACAVLGGRGFRPERVRTRIVVRSARPRANKGAPARDLGPAVNVRGQGSVPVGPPPAVLLHPRVVLVQPGPDRGSASLQRALDRLDCCGDGARGGGSRNRLRRRLSRLPANGSNASPVARSCRGVAFTPTRPSRFAGGLTTARTELASLAAGPDRVWQRTPRG